MYKYSVPVYLSNTCMHCCLYLCSSTVLHTQHNIANKIVEVNINKLIHYHAMLRRARLCYGKPSVRLSVCLWRWMFTPFWEIGVAEHLLISCFRPEVEIRLKLFITRGIARFPCDSTAFLFYIGKNWESVSIVPYLFCCCLNLYKLYCVILCKLQLSHLFYSQSLANEIRSRFVAIARW